MLREAGAAKIHLCISSPPIYWPCFYGIDTPSQEDLVACKYTKEEIANFISADSLTYLSIEAIYKALGGNEYCDACFTGNYPVPIPVKKQQKKYQLKVI
jgi:amidophosphoribosyltransferase